MVIFDITSKSHRSRSCHVASVNAPGHTQNIHIAFRNQIRSPLMPYMYYLLSLSWRGVLRILSEKLNVQSVLYMERLMLSMQYVGGNGILIACRRRLWW